MNLLASGPALKLRNQEEAMLQLSKQWRASCLPADAQQASGPRHISPRNPNPHSSGPRKTLTRTSLSFFAVALGALCASWPGMAAGADQTIPLRLENPKIGR